MLSFNNYHRPEALETAYEILNKHKRSQLVGGGAFLRMGNRKLTDVVDLSALELDFLHTDKTTIEIGAMTSFHTLETAAHLSQRHRAFFRQALGQIVGVQLRNMVTVGGTVYSRYGFSDLNTALLALGGAVHLYKAGETSIESFFEQTLPDRDILEKVCIPSSFDFASFKSARLSTADYALLNLAVTLTDGKYRLAVGARPHRAKLAHKTMAFLNGGPLTPERIEKATVMLASEITFGSNRMASKAYRKAVSKGLLKEALNSIYQEVHSSEN